MYGRSQDKAEKYGEKYGVQGFSDIHDMIVSAGIEAVIICTPHPAHRNAAVIASEAGAHVLVEKPLASSLQDCDAMLAAARKANVKIGTVASVVFMPRFSESAGRLMRGKSAPPLWELC